MARLTASVSPHLANVVCAQRIGLSVTRFQMYELCEWCGLCGFVDSWNTDHAAGERSIETRGKNLAQ
jgi:hypothetical protein